MLSKNELWKKIEDGYPKFSKGQRKLADFIRTDYDKAAFLTAAKMGEEVGVSESTVVRFAMALGIWYGNIQYRNSRNKVLCRWCGQSLTPSSGWR